MPTAGVKDRWIGGDGPVPADLMIVGEAPAKEEVAQGRALVGRSGQELFSQLYRWGRVLRDDCFVTNVFPFPLKKHEKDIKPQEWTDARDRLAIDIIDVQPRVILALGAVAVHALLPDSNRHDLNTLNNLPHWLYEGVRSGPIIIPSYHPAASFRDSSSLEYLIRSCTAVKEALAGKLVPQPFRNIATEITSLKDHIAPEHTLTALDTETLRDGSAYIVGVSSLLGRAACLMAYDRRQIEQVARHVARPDVTTLLHNALFDLPVLESVGIQPRKWLDTMSIAFMVQYLPLSLKELSYRLLHTVMREYLEVVEGYDDLSQVPDRDSVMQYAAGDPNVTLRLYHALLPMWYKGMEDILQLDMDIQPMVIEMMRRGMPVNKQFLKDLDMEFEARNFTQFLDIEKFAKARGFVTPEKTGKNKGMYFNPRSGDQVRELLFEKMKLGRSKNIKKTPTGKLSTSKKQTAKMRDEHGIVKMLDDYRATATLRSSFAKKLPKHIEADGRIHANLSMTNIIHSGRFASTRPNLLGIPVRSDDGRRIREGFQAPDGWEFMAADLGQIELRVLAHESQDKEMLRVYRSGLDIHSNTGMRIFGIDDPSKLDDYKHRLPSKTVNFGIVNKISAQGLSRELIPIAGASWTEAVCEDFIQSWFSVYPGVKEHLDNIGNMAMRNGFVVDMWGMKELLPQMYSCFEYTVEEGKRIACNKIIQSGAQGIEKRIMRNIWVNHGIRWMKDDIAYPLLQVHDDIIHEYKIPKRREIATAIQYEMENSVKLSIPVTGDIKVGRTWGGLKKLEMVY